MITDYIYITTTLNSFPAEAAKTLKNPNTSVTTPLTRSIYNPLQHKKQR